ncbi:MAG: hypothetical protein ACTJHU_09425, partial [Mycetocola sp.]
MSRPRLSRRLSAGLAAVAGLSLIASPLSPAHADTPADSPFALSEVTGLSRSFTFSNHPVVSGSTAITAGLSTRLNVINTDSGQVSDAITIPAVDTTPYNLAAVAYDPDTNRAFSSSTVKTADGDLQIRVTDATTFDATTWTIPASQTVDRLGSIALDATHDRLYVQAQSGSTFTAVSSVIVLDTNSGDVVGSVDGAYYLIGIDEANDRAIARGLTDDIITVNGDGTQGDTLLSGPVTTNASNARSAAAPTTGKIVVTDTIVDIATGATQKLDGFDFFSTSYKIIADDDNGIVYYLNPTTGELAVVDLTSGDTVATLSTGLTSAQFALDSTSNELSVFGTTATGRGFLTVTGANDYEPAEEPEPGFHLGGPVPLDARINPATVQSASTHDALYAGTATGVRTINTSGVNPATTSEPLATLQNITGTAFPAFAFDDTGDLVYTSAYDATDGAVVNVTRISDGETIATWPIVVPAADGGAGTDRASALALDSENKRLYVQVGDGSTATDRVSGVAVINTSTGKLVGSVAGQRGQYLLGGIDQTANRALVSAASEFRVGAISGQDGSFTPILDDTPANDLTWRNLSLNAASGVTVTQNGTGTPVIVDFSTGAERTVSLP